jgi:hypothetical protein
MLAFACILHFPPFFVHKMIEVFKTSNNGWREVGRIIGMLLFVCVCMCVCFNY